MYARLALERGNVASAGHEMSLAAVYDPQSPWPRYAMARDKLERGERDDAETNVRIALQIDPQHVPSLLLRAQMLVNGGEVERAATALSKAAEADASDPRALIFLGRLRAQSGKLDEAKMAMEKLEAVWRLGEHSAPWTAEVRDAAADASLVVAQAFERKHRDEEADRFFLRSLSMSERSVSRVDAYVAFLESRNRTREAASLAEQSLALEAPNATRVLRTARLLLAARRPDAAVAYVSLLAEVSTKEDTALVELGASLLKEREPARALIAFEAALSMGFEYPDARGYQAMTLEVLGKFKQAIHSYQQVFTDETIGAWARARAASCERRLASEAVLMGTQMAESGRFVQASTIDAPDGVLPP